MTTGITPAIVAASASVDAAPLAYRKTGCRPLSPSSVQSVPCSVGHPGSVFGHRSVKRGLKSCNAGVFFAGIVFPLIRSFSFTSRMPAVCAVARARPLREQRS